MKHLLEVKNMHSWYGRIHAVNNVSFTLDKGEIVGLVGDNGAGKSTLVNAISGLKPLDEGEIYWKGEKVDINSVKDSRNLKIETIYQGAELVDERSVVQNIFLGKEPTNLGPLKILDKEKMRAKAKKAIRKLGLDLSPDQKAEACSGGERKGITIAKALVSELELVIFDEPTAGLSIQAIENVLSYLSELRDSGVSVIFISHNVDHVFSIADKFIVLFEGEKVGDARKGEISKEKLMELQVSGG